MSHPDRDESVRASLFDDHVAYEYGSMTRHTSGRRRRAQWSSDANQMHWCGDEHPATKELDEQAGRQFSIHSPEWAEHESHETPEWKEHHSHENIFEAHLNPN